MQIDLIATLADGQILTGSVTLNPALKILSIVPSSVAEGGGTAVVVTLNAAPGPLTSVTLGGKPVLNLQVVADKVSFVSPSFL